MSTAPPPGTGSPKAGLWILGAAVVLGLAVFGGDADDATTTDSAALDAMEPVDAPAVAEVEVAVDPVPSTPVDRAILRRASAHYRLATRDEGVGGAVVYSRNCYAGLKAAFNWARLDICGAFDATAADRYADEASGPGAGWLEGETAAGRYLAAAIAAGMPPTDADVRLAALQASARVPGRAAAVAVPEIEEPSEAVSPGLAGADAAADATDVQAAQVEVPPLEEPSLPPDSEEGAPLDPP